MKEHILIISNSHIASVMHAYNDFPAQKDYEIDFLTYRGGRSAPDISVKDNCIKAISPSELIHRMDGEKARSIQILNIEKYEYIVLYGMQLRTKGGSYNFISNMNKFLYSMNQFMIRRKFSEFLTDSFHYKFLSQFPEEIKEKTVSIPSPFILETHPAIDEKKYNLKVISSINKFTKEIIEKINGNFLDTPKEFNGIVPFSTSRLFKNDREDDHFHLNKNGGKILLHHILKWLNINVSEQVSNIGKENPYKSLPSRNFWAPAVAQRDAVEVSDVFTPKFSMTSNTAIVSYGSCFSQQISKHLKQSNFNWLCTEPKPDFLNDEEGQACQFGIFSSRTGNIYTASLLKQWTEWAFQVKEVSCEIWEEDGRFYDPLRPSIQENGFDTKEELLASRTQTLDCFKRSILEAEVFLFTLGLTECWINVSTGHEYVMCPGTSAGTFCPENHQHVTQNYSQIYDALVECLNIMRKENPKLKMILTVSPVPLTATMQDQHALVSNMETKSMLRTVAGQLAKDFEYIDYFPSYELIASPAFEGQYYNDNKRTISPDGIEHVMRIFFRSYGLHNWKPLQKGLPTDVAELDESMDDEDVMCDEEILEAFYPDVK